MLLTFAFPKNKWNIKINDDTKKVSKLNIKIII